ncbi:hypothetical protein LTS18_009999, partial [Coniosporium uncinatum]
MSKPPASLLTLPRELRQPLLLHLLPSDTSLPKHTPTSLITHAMSFYDLHPVLATDMKWVLAQWQQRHQEMWKVYSARRREVRAVARKLVEEVEKRRVGVGTGLTRSQIKRRIRKERTRERAEMLAREQEGEDWREKTGEYGSEEERGVNREEMVGSVVSGVVDGSCTRSLAGRAIEGEEKGTVSALAEKRRRRGKKRSRRAKNAA